MLFIKHTYESGKTRLFPIKNDNVFVLCDYCGEMVPVPDPAGFIYESGACGSSIEAPELCDRCREMKNRMEEIIYAWNHTYTIRA